MKSEDLDESSRIVLQGVDTFAPPWYVNKCLVTEAREEDDDEEEAA